MSELLKMLLRLLITRRSSPLNIKSFPHSVHPRMQNATRNLLPLPNAFDELARLRGVLEPELFHRQSRLSPLQHGHFTLSNHQPQRLSEERQGCLLDEVAILKEVEHSHIIRLRLFHGTRDLLFGHGTHARRRTL
jgi:hypothetical protein